MNRESRIRPDEPDDRRSCGFDKKDSACLEKTAGSLKRILTVRIIAASVKIPGL